MNWQGLAFSGKWFCSILVVMLSGCMVMKAPEVDYQGVEVQTVEPKGNCTLKGNIVGESRAAIETIGDDAISMNRRAMQDVVDQAVDIGANYVYVEDHRQYSNQPKKGLVYRSIMKSKAYVCSRPQTASL
jgi:hypothetical protein